MSTVEQALQEKEKQIIDLCAKLGVQSVKFIDMGLGGSDDVHVLVSIGSGNYDLLETDDYYQRLTFQELDDKGRKVGWFGTRLDGAIANIQNIVASMVDDNISVRKIVVSPHSISKLLKGNKI